jgi:hypothetical protein
MFPGSPRMIPGSPGMIPVKPETAYWGDFGGF